MNSTNAVQRREPYLSESRLAGICNHCQCRHRLLLNVLPHLLTQQITSLNPKPKQSGKRRTELAASPGGIRSFNKRSTIGSRYGTSVSRATPSQKLMRAAAACEWTLVMKNHWTIHHQVVRHTWARALPRLVSKLRTAERGTFPV
jgi:hypothetical protein